jgi:hypothetical protein
LPALVQEAPELPSILDTTRDVLLGYLGRVDALAQENLTGDPFDSAPSGARAVHEEDLKLCREMHVWTRYVLDCLGSFRSGLKAPSFVGPPSWRVDQDELKGRLASSS